LGEYDHVHLVLECLVFHAVHGLQVTAVQCRVFDDCDLGFDDGFVQVLGRVTVDFEFRVVEVLFATFVFFELELHEYFTLVQHVVGVDDAHETDRLGYQHSEFLRYLNLFLKYNVV